MKIFPGAVLPAALPLATTSALTTVERASKVDAFVKGVSASAAEKPFLPGLLRLFLTRPGVVLAEPGRHSLPTSPIFGTRVDAFETYRAFTAKNPAFVRFGSALYADAKDRADFYMIPAADRDEAEALAKSMYETFCSERGLDPDTAVVWMDGGFRAGVTFTYERRENEDSATSHAAVDADGITVGEGESVAHFSRYLVAIHELFHVERTAKDATGDPLSDSETAVSEIAAVIDGILRQDAIYKKIHGIDPNETVSYPRSFGTDKGGSLNPGEIAVFFRPLAEKYGGVEEALMSKEASEFIAGYYSSDDLVPAAAELEISLRTRDRASLPRGR